MRIFIREFALTDSFVRFFFLVAVSRLVFAAAENGPSLAILRAFKYIMQRVRNWLLLAPSEIFGRMQWLEFDVLCARQ